MSIKDDWKRFIDPLENEIKNLGHIKEDIRYAVLDKLDEMNGTSETNKNNKASPTEHGGCLKKLLVYGFLIIAILAFFRNGCSFNSTIERDGTAVSTSYDKSDPMNESKTLYDSCIQRSKDNIVALMSAEEIDTDALEEEYCFLLTCLASEYMFKSMAYGHFTEEYEATRYDHILKECAEITEQIKNYVSAKIIDELYTTISVQAYQSFDDTMFNYDSCLVGTPESPDIDAMWYAYFNSLLGTNG